jgi:hypothetical protein
MLEATAVMMPMRSEAPVVTKPAAQPSQPLEFYHE